MENKKTIRPSFEVQQIIDVLRDVGLEVKDGPTILGGKDTWWFRVKLPEPQGVKKYQFYFSDVNEEQTK